DDIKDSELSISIPLRSLYEYFLCPICLSEYTVATTLTSCGHIYCDKCIRECVNRNQKCPLCQIECTEAQLVPNKTLDQLLQTIKIEKEKAAQENINKIINTTNNTNNTNINDNNTNNAQSNPIQAIFRRHAFSYLLG